MTLENTYTDVPADIFINSKSIFYKRGSNLKYINIKETKEINKRDNFVLKSIGDYAFIRTKEQAEILDKDFETKYSCLFEQSNSRQFQDYLMDKFLFKEINDDNSNLREYSKSDSPVDLIITDDNAFYLDIDNIVLYNAKELTLYSKSNATYTYKIDFATALNSRSGTIFSQNIQSSDRYIFFYAHSSDWSKYSFFVIDAESGKTTSKTNLFGPHFKYHNEKIYSVGRNTSMLQLMELTDFSIETIDLSSELGEYVFETQCKPFFHNNKLYTALKKKGEDIYSYWGQINLESYELEFITEMLRDQDKKSTKENKTFVSMIKANDEIVGVKVPGGILHVYKIGD